MYQLLTYLQDLLDDGEIETVCIPSATGDILSIKTSGEKNAELAKAIAQKVEGMMKAYKLR
jgi:hypothetical protein